MIQTGSNWLLLCLTTKLVNGIGWISVPSRIPGVREEAQLPMQSIVLLLSLESKKGNVLIFQLIGTKNQTKEVGSF